MKYGRIIKESNDTEGKNMNEVEIYMKGWEISDTVHMFTRLLNALKVTSMKTRQKGTNTTSGSRDFNPLIGGRGTSCP
jgi:hypothetical protein